MRPSPTLLRLTGYIACFILANISLSAHAQWDVLNDTATPPAEPAPVTTDTEWQQQQPADALQVEELNPQEQVQDMPQGEIEAPQGIEGGYVAPGEDAYEQQRMEAESYQQQQEEPAPATSTPPTTDGTEQREGSELPVIMLRGLNKVTAKTEAIALSVGQAVRFGNLEIQGNNCWKAAPTERPEAAALLDIWEYRPDTTDPVRLFVGWMFASSPSVSAMEHPVYDVTVTDCVKTAPDTDE